jgi:hypothetical protein
MYVVVHGCETWSLPARTQFQGVSRESNAGALEVKTQWQEEWENYTVVSFEIGTFTTCKGDRINKNEMGRACSIHWHETNSCKSVAEQYQGQRLLGRHMRGWEENIKMVVQRVSIEYVYMNLIQVVRKSMQWPAAGGIVSTLLFRWTVGNFFTSLTTVSVYVCSAYWGFDKRIRRVSCSSVRILLTITGKGGPSDLVSGYIRHCHKCSPRTYQLHVRLKAMQDKRRAQR